MKSSSLELFPPADGFTLTHFKFPLTAFFIITASSNTPHERYYSIREQP